MNQTITFLTASLAVATASARADDDNQQKTALPEVLLLGDSIRMSYQAGVKRRLNGVARVWAPGDNCRDTQHTLGNLDRWLDGHDPTVVHINCGLHDMWLFDAEKRRHSVAVYTANLRKILLRLRKKTDATIVFALTTPVHEANQAASGYGRVVRYEKDIPRYNAAATELARELQVPIDDLYTPLFQAGIETTIGKDGVHLSDKGVSIVEEKVADCIRAKLTGRK